MPQAVAYVGAYLLMSTEAVALGAFLLSNAAIIANVALLIGGLAYSSYKSRQAKEQARQEYNAAQVDRLASVSSALAARDLVLGRVRKAGTVFYRGSTGANSQDLYMAIALAGHEIDAVETIYLNDVPVTLDGSGYVTTAPWTTTTTLTASGTGPVPTLPASYVAGTLTSGTYGDAGTEAYSYQYTQSTSNVRVTIYLGASGQTADPSLLAAFSSDWSSANVVSGVAYLVVKLTYNETSFPSGVPSVSAVIRGAKIYDPRTGTTAWSQNPALMMRHVYTHPRFGKASVSTAEDVRFIAAANSCDTSTVYTVAGVAQTARALYQGNLVAPFGSPAKDLLDDLAQAMGGSWAFAGGELYLKPGIYSAPVLSLDDADLAVIQRDGASTTQRPITIAVHRERAQKINTVKPKIWDAAQDYKQTSLTPLVGSALLARDGVELAQEVTFAAIGYAPQALHVAGILMRDARDPLVVSLPFKLRAYPLELFDTVSLTLSRYGWSAKTFMIMGRSWNADGSLELTLKETSAAITTLDASFAAQGFASNSNLGSPWYVAPPGPLTLSSGTAELLRQNDGTVVSRMRVSWAQVSDAAVRQAGQIEVQYRNILSAGAWSSLVVAGDETQVVTTEVGDGETYTVRARAKSTLATSDWSTQAVHTVVGKSEAPAAFDAFVISAQPDGTRQYNFSYSAAKPADWLGAEIRYISGTVPSPSWAEMTPLQDSTTYYTASPVELNAPLSGTWTFACRSVDTSGNASAALVRTITLPDRRLGNVFAEYFEHLEGWSGTKTSSHLQQGYLEANDSTTWSGLSTWSAYSRWNLTPASPIVYETPVRDFGTVVSGQINSTLDADGAATQELATSSNGTTWSAWGSATAAFSTRYIKLRLTLAANGTYPVPLARSWSYRVDAPMRSEYLNDINIASLTGSYRLGVGDIRIPLAGSYSVIKRTTIVVQDNSAGTWTYARLDQSLSPAPRWQFRLNGTLADPALVDFYIEGY